MKELRKATGSCRNGYQAKREVYEENMGTHPLGKLDKLKRVSGYLINWMISVDS